MNFEYEVSYVEVADFGVVEDFLARAVWVTLGIIAISIGAVLATTDRSDVDLISFHDTDDQELARDESASGLSLSSTAGDRTEEGLRK